MPIALPKLPKLKAFPKSMGACADLLHQMRADRLNADKFAEELKKRENELKEHIINNLPKGDEGAVGKTHRVVIVRKTKQNVKDWNAFFGYVKKNNAFDLVQRRISEKAVQDRLDDGKKIPGLEPFQVVDISLTKK